jgi:hypothetical protein
MAMQRNKDFVLYSQKVEYVHEMINVHKIHKPIHPFTLRVDPSGRQPAGQEQ